MFNLRKLARSRFVSNVAAMAGGAAAGQAVAFMFSPLITRIYTPSAFGLQGIFLSLVSILTPVVALRYPMAIVIARSERRAERLARLSLWISLFVSAGVAFILLILRDEVLAITGAEKLGSLVWLLPLALLCVGLQDVTTFRASRLAQFDLIARTTVIQALLTNLARVLGGLIAPVAGVLIIVTSVAPAVQAAMLRKRMPASNDARPGLSIRSALMLMRAHKDFPIYRSSTDVLNSASQSVPVIMLSALYTPTAAGLYVLTRSVLNLPVNVIGAAAGNVLYARFAELARAKEPLLPLLRRSTLALLAMSPLVIGGAWFAPPLFAYIFGDEWREAGEYAWWMSIWIAMMIANVPSVKIVPVINRQGLSLALNIVLLLFRVSSVWLTWRLYGDAVTAVACFSISSSIVIGLSILIMYWQTAMNDSKRINGHG